MYLQSMPLIQMYGCVILHDVGIRSPVDISAVHSLYPLQYLFQSHEISFWSHPGNT